jgi:hypothetical protein
LPPLELRGDVRAFGVGELVARLQHAQLDVQALEILHGVRVEEHAGGSTRGDRLGSARGNHERAPCALLLHRALGLGARLDAPHP